MKAFMRYNFLRLKSLMRIFSLLFLFILYFKFKRKKMKRNNNGC